MEISFVTTNKGKYEEVKALFSKYGIAVEQVDMEYPEDHDSDIHTIACEGARYCASKLQKPVVVEDTGVFFSDYNNFPGIVPKIVWKGIGPEGIFKLMEGTSRKAYFETVAAFAQPEEEPVTFEGRMDGVITKEVRVPDYPDHMGYDKIFMPEGESRSLAEMTVEEKNTFSHRSKAFKKLAEWLQNRQ